MEKFFAIVDVADRVMFGLSEVPMDHPAMLRLCPAVPFSELEVGQTTIATPGMAKERGGDIFVKRVL